MIDNESYSVQNQINNEKSLMNSEEKRELIVQRKISKKWSFLEVILIVMAFILLIIGLGFFILYLVIDQVPSLYENDQIKRPLLDNRKYEIIQLLNGMNVMLISDSSLSFASVGLSVNSGFSDDLKYKLYGIGALVKEVVLNKKQKEGLNELLSESYGSILHQEISLFDTSMSFEVGHERFQKSLELFANIIKFSYQNRTSEVLQSIQAGVNKLNNDYKSAPFDRDISITNLLYHVLGYPMAYFPTGSLNTFLNSTFTIKNLTAMVMRYYKENYIGPNMKLVLLAKMPLKEIKGIVIKLFSSIPQSQPNAPKAKEDKPLTIPSSKQKLGEIVVMKLNNMLNIFRFIFVYDNVPYDTNYLYFEYLKYVFNDKFEGSLYYLLQKSQLISNLMVSYDIMKENTLRFQLNFELTPHGYARIDEVVYQTANFIKVIRSQKVNETIYEDMKRVQTINFKFRSYDSSDRELIAKLAKNMELFKDHLTDLQMTNNYTPDINPAYLNAILDLLRMDNCVLVFNCHKLADASIDILAKMTEKAKPFEFTPDEVYRIPFARAAIAGKEIDRMNKDASYDKYLRIRKTNDYVTNLTKLVSPSNEEEKTKLKPNVIIDENHLKIWHKYDRTFRSPKVSFELIFNSPFHPSDDEKLYALFLYHFQFLVIAINQELFEAREAGSSIQVVSNDATIGIYIETFSDLYEKLVTKLLELYYNPSSSIISEEVIIQLTNTRLNLLSDISFSKNSNDLIKGLLKNKLLVEFKHYDPLNTTDINGEIIKMVNQSYLRAVIYGNVDQDSASRFCKRVIFPYIDFDSIYFAKMYGLYNDGLIFDYLTEVKDIQGNAIFRVGRNQSEQGDSYVANNFYLGNSNNENNTIFIHLIINTFKKNLKAILPLSPQLKTGSTYIYSLGSNWYLVVLGSGKADPRVLTKAMDEALLEARSKVEALDEDEEMYKIKESIFNFLTAKEKNLGDRTSKVRAEIKLNRYAFDSAKKLTIEELNAQFTKKVLLAKFNELFITNVKRLSFQKNASAEITFEDDGYCLNKLIPTVVTNDTSYFHRKP